VLSLVVEVGGQAGCLHATHSEIVTSGRSFAYRATGQQSPGRFFRRPGLSRLARNRYIELNPVRAGMVGHPSVYRWPSYDHIVTGRCDYPISPHAQWLAPGRIEQSFAEVDPEINSLLSCLRQK